MKPRSCTSIVVAALAGIALPTLVACNDSAGYIEPAPRPQIVGVVGPKDSVVTCDPSVTGGTCAVPVTITFRLPDSELVWKAYVRFQGDGSEEGVDRSYLLPPTYGKNTEDVSVIVSAQIPPNILSRGQLFSYSVRLVTGNGEESTPSKLGVSVQ